MNEKILLTHFNSKIELGNHNFYLTQQVDRFCTKQNHFTRTYVLWIFSFGENPVASGNWESDREKGIDIGWKKTRSRDEERRNADEEGDFDFNTCKHG